MRERFIRFMSGRNGNDPLNMFLLAVSLVLLVISTIFSRGFGSYLYPLVLAVLGYSTPEIRQALQGVEVEPLSREEIIKAALKNMVK